MSDQKLPPVIDSGVHYSWYEGNQRNQADQGWHLKQVPATVSENSSTNGSIDSVGDPIIRVVKSCSTPGSGKAEQ